MRFLEGLNTLEQSYFAFLLVILVCTVLGGVVMGLYIRTATKELAAKATPVAVKPVAVVVAPRPDATIISSFTRQLDTRDERGYIQQTLVQYKQGITCVTVHSGVGNNTLAISCVPTQRENK